MGRTAADIIWWTIVLLSDIADLFSNIADSFSNITSV